MAKRPRSYVGGFQSKPVFAFEKHRQRRIEEVDDGYLQYIVNKFPESDLWSKSATSALTSRKMIQQSAKANVHDLLSDLKSCARKRDLQKGREVHTNAVEAGIDSHVYVANALINLYSKCRSMEAARTVFDSMKKPDVVSWNCLILGYADNGQGRIALDLFSRMKDEGLCAPKSSTYVAALKACSSLAEDGGEAGKQTCLERARQIHSDIGNHMDHLVQSTLINLYAKCGSMEAARIVFDGIKEPDVVSWTTLILGYADNGQGDAALDLFSRMKNESKCAPDSLTYVAALKACTLLAADGLERGRQIHSDIGCHMDHILQNTLVNLYAKCGSMNDARIVFDNIKEPNVVSWTTLILGYAENGQGLVALDMFSWMKDKERMNEQGRCKPNSLTYVAALKACTLLAADEGEAGRQECLERGRQIHSDIGRHMDHFVQSMLINLYAKCGSLDDARTVFDSIKEPDVVSWTSLILGYAENGQALAAIDVFSRMKDEGICAPNSLTYFAVLKACCSIGALAIGRKIHSLISEYDSRLVTCLVDFYAKCGSMDEAREVLDLHPQERILSTWNAILAGYALFGDTVSAFSLFETMQDQGFQPDAVTFVCMLSCCSHAGLIEKAWEYLEVMSARYGVAPTVKHYSCMIDLLGRANKLDEAVALLQKMPCDPDAVTWAALLGACHKWKNAKIGRWAFKSLIDLDKRRAPAYVLMAEIYRSKGMWEEQEKVLEAGMKFGTCNLPGKAYVMDGQARSVEFVVGEDDSADDGLQEFLGTLKEQGYVAESYGMGSCLENHVKEKALCGHSQRRAVVHGILNTSPGEVIRVVSNTRMCNDCHSATKMISKFSKRVIMVRDDSRFHVMDNGNCSCRDYF